MINGNMVGGTAPIKTVKIVDENGNEILGVVTENLVVFDAKPSDVKINKTFASDDGVQIGENTITYRTTQGRRGIPSGSSVSIPLSDYAQYDYTKFQCIITSFNTNLNNSTAAIKISINDDVFNVGSTDVVSSITKNIESESIDLNITNDTDNIIVVYYMTYKEED